MVICQFIFKPGVYDDDFNRLDAAIEAYAQGLPGYVGVETWQTPEGSTKNAIYYFEDMTGVRELARFPSHLEAKGQYQRWYDGYQIIVSEFQTAYGDGRLTHLTNRDA